MRTLRQSIQSKTDGTPSKTQMVFIIYLIQWMICSIGITSALAIPDISLSNILISEIPNSIAYQRRHSVDPISQRRDTLHPSLFRNKGNASGRFIFSTSTNNEENIQNNRGSPISSSYYLITSRKALLQIVFVTLSLLVLHRYQSHVPLLANRINFLSHQAFVSNPACHISSSSSFPSVITQYMLPILSSACCIVQLVFNLLSIGCFGFNTYLGPIRPFFIGILGYFSILSYHSLFWKKTGGTTPILRYMIQFLLTWGMALLPEMLFLWNSKSNSTPNASSSKPKTSISSTIGPSSSHSHKTVKVQLYIPTMGCVACINKIDSSLSNYLEQTLNVNVPSTSVTVKAKAHSWLLDPNQSSNNRTNEQSTIYEWLRQTNKLVKGGIAQISIDMRHDNEDENTTNLDSILTNASLIQAIKEAGFKDCEMISWCTN